MEEPPKIGIAEHPQALTAWEARQRQEELREVELVKRQRELEVPLIKEATTRMEWLINSGCMASEGAAAVLRYCYRGGPAHTLKYDDLGRMDAENTEQALFLIGTVARQKHTFPETYLTPTGLALFA